MKDKILISGFADEICDDFREQLETVTQLGMHHISLRSANKKGVADYTVEEAKETSKCSWTVPSIRKATKVS